MERKSGKQIMGVANFVFIIQILFAIIAFFVSIVLAVQIGTFVVVLLGLLMAAVIIFAGWVSTMLLHGFGLLVDSSSRTADFLEQNYGTIVTPTATAAAAPTVVATPEPTPAPPPAKPVVRGDLCLGCGTPNPDSSAFCANCGKALK